MNSPLTLRRIWRTHGDILRLGAALALALWLVQPGCGTPVGDPVAPEVATGSAFDVEDEPIQFGILGLGLGAWLALGALTGGSTAANIAAQRSAANTNRRAIDAQAEEARLAIAAQERQAELDRGQRRWEMQRQREQNAAAWDAYLGIMNPYWQTGAAAHSRLSDIMGLGRPAGRGPAARMAPAVAPPPRPVGHVAAHRKWTGHRPRAQPRADEHPGVGGLPRHAAPQWSFAHRAHGPTGALAGPSARWDGAPTGAAGQDPVQHLQPLWEPSGASRTAMTRLAQAPARRLLHDAVPVELKSLHRLSRTARDPKVRAAAQRRLRRMDARVLERHLGTKRVDHGQRGDRPSRSRSEHGGRR